MRAIKMETHDGIFRGYVSVLIMNKNHLEDLITKLKNVSGVHTVERVKAVITYLCNTVSDHGKRRDIYSST